MAARLIMAPPGCGKTRLCLQLAQDRSGLAQSDTSEQKILGQVWVLVPDQPQVRSFQQRLAQIGGSLGVRISTFEALYQEILERIGHPVPVADERVQFRLIQSIAAELYKAGSLEHYASIHHMPGFINALRQRFAEFKRARVLPEKLVESASTGPAGLDELASIYLAYQTGLQGLDWADREGLSWLAVEAYEKQPGLLADYDLLILDGFDSFTPTQLDILELLTENLPEVVITLPGIPGSQRSADRRFSDAQSELERRLHPQINTLSEQPHLPPALAALQAGLFETIQPIQPALSGFCMLEVRSPAEEAREALRWIKAQLVRQPGLATQQAAIFTPEPDLHLPYLGEVAEEFKLPICVDIPTLLNDTPAVQALTMLLSLSIDDYPRLATLEATRSPFFDLSAWDLGAEQAAVMELISYVGRVVGGRAEWLQAFEYLGDTLGETEQTEFEEETDIEDWTAPRIPGRTKFVKLRASFQEFYLDRLDPRGVSDLGTWISWLDALLSELNYWARIDPATSAALQRLLQSLRFSSQTADHQLFNYAQFLSELVSAIQGETFYPGDISNQDGIRVAHLASARGLRYQIVVILGLSEGIFPQVERPDPFLPEDLRQAFGLEPQLGRGQASLFYQAVTRADQTLLLTRPYLAEGGEAWEPSPYWSAATTLFPDSVFRLSPNELRELNQAASRAELLFWAARRGADLPANYGLSERQAALDAAREVLAARLDHTPQGIYDGYPLELVENLTERYGPQHIWSASRLETYTSCPHRFYVQSTLQLEPLIPPAPGLEPSQIGSLLHELLNLAYRTASSRSEPQEVETALRASAPEVFARAPQKLGFHPSALWEVEKEQWLEALIATIHGIAEEGQGWEPTDFELAFGFGGQAPLELETTSGIIRLRGLIDRLDRSPGGGMRVIDYKTGGSHLTKSDLLRGLRLQLPLYAQAAEAIFGEQVSDGFYWSISGTKAGSLRLSKFEEEGYPPGTSGAVLVALDHVQRAVQGIREAVFPPQPPPGGCPAYCPAAAWCWRYEPSGW